MRRRSLALVSAVLFLAVACEGGAPVARDPQDAVSPTSVDADDEGAETPAPRTVLEHSCIGDGVGPFRAEGQYPPAKDWREQELVIGNLGFEDHDGSENQRPHRFAAKDGEYRAYGFAIIVPAGKTATLKVVRGRAAFMVDPGGPHGGPWFRLSDGLRVLRLTACEEEDTRFLEALIVGGAQCVRLRVATRGGTEGAVDMPFAMKCP